MHIVKKCMAQEAKSPVKILSSSVAQRDLILGLKGYKMLQLNIFSTLFVGSAGISYRRFIALHCRFKCPVYFQEPLAIGGVENRAI
jgi:hypothetical protein